MRLVREWAVVAAAYVTIRLLIISPHSPRRHPDTASYELPVSFIGGQPRPWVIPLLRSAVPDDLIVYVHAGLSGVAFLVLAVALASLMRDWRARLLVLCAALGLGLTPRVTMWDPYLLSESVAISLTVLLIAGLAHIGRVAADWRWSVVSVVVFTLWIFTRDGNLAVGILVVIAFTAVAVQARRWLLPALIVPVYLWGWAAAMNDDYIEGYNVVVNVAFHVAPDEGRVEWFAERGMPVVAGFDVPDLEERTTALRTDPEFRPWANTTGRTEYTRFLVTHPLFALEGLPALFTSDSEGEGLLDDPRRTRPHFASTTEMLDWLWPPSSGYFLALLPLTALAIGVSVWLRSRRVIAPSLLVMSTVPHSVIAFHGSPQEVARHGVVLALLLVIACWWCIAVALDDWLGRSDGVSDDHDAGPTRTAVATAATAGQTAATAATAGVRGAGRTVGGDAAIAATTRATGAGTRAAADVTA